jgi:HigB_toxin, RelE-like toxic component of a toxin-antitoxin system
MRCLRDIVTRAEWRNPEDVKASYPKASILKAGRVVFNIKGNDYRLIAHAFRHMDAARSLGFSPIAPRSSLFGTSVASISCTLRSLTTGGPPRAPIATLRQLRSSSRTMHRKNSPD